MANNGFGPDWLPEWARKVLTKFGLLFFAEASWARHDEGYSRGFPARHICDRKFLQAMLRDASKTQKTYMIATCTILAWAIWLLVRLFGWTSYKTVRPECSD